MIEQLNHRFLTGGSMDPQVVRGEGFGDPQMSTKLSIRPPLIDSLIKFGGPLMTNLGVSEDKFRF